LLIHEASRCHGQVVWQSGLRPARWETSMKQSSSAGSLSLCTDLTHRQTFCAKLTMVCGWKSGAAEPSFHHTQQTWIAAHKG
jgi:hypothetical protein